MLVPCAHPEAPGSWGAAKQGRGARAPEDGTLGQDKGNLRGKLAQNRGVRDQTSLHILICGVGGGETVKGAPRAAGGQVGGERGPPAAGERAEAERGWTEEAASAPDAKEMEK